MIMIWLFCNILKINFIYLRVLGYRLSIQFVWTLYLFVIKYSCNVHEILRKSYGPRAVWPAVTWLQDVNNLTKYSSVRINYFFVLSLMDEPIKCVNYFITLNPSVCLLLRKSETKFLLERFNYVGNISEELSHGRLKQTTEYELCKNISEFKSVGCKDRRKQSTSHTKLWLKLLSWCKTRHFFQK
jgi:hypothetical protein